MREAASYLTQRRNHSLVWFRTHFSHALILLLWLSATAPLISAERVEAVDPPQAKVIDAFVLVPAGSTCNQAAVVTGQRPGASVLADGSQGWSLCLHISQAGSTNNIATPTTFLDVNDTPVGGAVANLAVSLGLLGTGTAQSSAIITNPTGYATTNYRGGGSVTATDSVSATVQSAVSATLDINLIPAVVAPTRVIDAFVLIPAGASCSQAAIASGQRPGAAVLADGSQARSLCLHVSQAGSTNNIESPTSFQDLFSTPVGGAVVNVSVGLGLLGTGTAQTLTVITNATGYATVNYRGGGSVAATDTASATVQGAGTPVVGALAIGLVPAVIAPTRVVDGLVLISANLACNQGTLASGQRSGTAVLADGSQGWTVCLHVSQAGSLNSIDSPATFSDANGVPVAGAVVTVAADLGLLGTGTTQSVVVITNSAGYATTIYRGGGNAAATATVTTATPQAPSAALAVNLTTGPTAPRVIDAFVLVPAGTGCSQAVVVSGQRPGAAVPADGSQGWAICLHVSQAGSSNSIDSPSSFLDANDTPVGGAVINVAVGLGVLGGGAAQSATVTTGPTGYATTTNYRGGGGVAATDTATATVLGATAAALSINLVPAGASAPRVIDAFVLVPAGSTCNQAAVVSGQRPGAAVVADGSQGWSLCVHVSQAGTTNNIDAPALFLDANDAPVGGAVVNLAASLGVLGTGTGQSTVVITNPTGYATTNYRGGGGLAATDSVAASVGGAVTAALGINLVPTVIAPTRVIDAFVLIPSGASCNQSGVLTGQRPGTAVLADGSQGWSLCLHVSQAGSLNSISSPSTFTDANDTPVGGAVVNLAVGPGLLGTGTAQSATVITGPTGYATTNYRGGGGIAATEAASATLQGAASAALSINLVPFMVAPTRVIDAFVLVPAGTGCSQPVVVAGQRPGVVLADGSQGWAICLHVSLAGSTNSINNPAGYLEGNGTPVGGAVVNVAAGLGFLGTGTTQTPTVITSPSGYATTNYRGGGGVAATDTVSASAEFATPASLQVNLTAGATAARVVDALVLIPVGTACNQSAVATGQRPGAAIPADGSQGWTLCLHVSQAGSTNYIDSPASFLDSHDTPVSGAVANITVGLGLLGGGTAQSATAITGPTGYATANYRGGGNAAATDTATVTVQGAPIASLTLNLVLAAPAPRVLDAFVLIPAGVACNQASVVSGQRASAVVVADGSQAWSLCVHVSQAGSLNNVDTPATFLDANDAPVGGAVVNLAVGLGLLGTGTAQSTVVITSGTGYATTNYRGGGGVTATETVTATVPGAAQGALTISLFPPVVAPTRVVDAFVLVPVGTTCNQFAVTSGQRPGTAVVADGSQAWSLCLHVSQAGSLNNLNSPATFADLNDTPAAGAVVNVTAGLGLLGSGSTQAATVITNVTGYATTNYRGGGGTAGTELVTATVQGAGTPVVGGLTINLVPFVIAPTRVIDAFVLLPAGVACTQSSVIAGQRPGAAVAADGSQAWVLCMHVSQAGSLNNINAPATFVETNAAPVGGAVVSLAAALGVVGTGSAQAVTAITGPTGYASTNYRGAGNVASTDITTAAVEFAVPATLDVNLVPATGTPARVIDAFVLIPSGTGCAQATVITGQRPGASVADGSEGWTLCLHVSQAGSTNNINTPASFLDAADTPAGGASVNVTVGIGLLGSGTAQSVTIITNSAGYATTVYRGAGSASAADVATATVLGAEPATLSLALVAGGATAPTLVSQTPPSPAVVGTPYSFQFTATGNPAPSFAVATGTLPAGVTLSAAGLLAGTPTTPSSSTFTVRASNGVPPSATSAALTIQVNAALTAPAFVNQTPTSPAVVGTPYSYTFTATGNPAPAFSLLSGAVPAGLTLSGGGVLAGTPTSAGSASFTVNASNGVAPNATTTSLTIQVNAAPNRPPSGVSDAYTANQGNTLVIAGAAGVLSNDSDPDPGTSLTAVQGTGPAHGTLTLQANGAFTYVPASGFSGSDSFTYRASDGSLSSGVVTVSITVRSLASIIDSQDGLTRVQKDVLKGALTLANSAHDQGRNAIACGALQAFIAGVSGLTPRFMTPATAAILITGARDLRTLYGCP